MLRSFSRLDSGNCLSPGAPRSSEGQQETAGERRGALRTDSHGPRRARRPQRLPPGEGTGRLRGCTGRPRVCRQSPEPALSLSGLSLSFSHLCACLRRLFSAPVSCAVRQLFSATQPHSLGFALLFWHQIPEVVSRRRQGAPSLCLLRAFHGFRSYVQTSVHAEVMLTCGVRWGLTFIPRVAVLFSQHHLQRDCPFSTAMFLAPWW